MMAILNCCSVLMFCLCTSSLVHNTNRHTSHGRIQIDIKDTVLPLPTLASCEKIKSETQHLRYLLLFDHQLIEIHIIPAASYAICTPFKQVSLPKPLCNERHASSTKWSAANEIKTECVLGNICLTNRCRSLSHAVFLWLAHPS